MDAIAFQAHARDLIFRGPGHSAALPEVDLRRALSPAYYGLFHTLTTAGSMLFSAGEDALRFQAARAFSHTAMRKVCDAYVRSPQRPFPPALQHLCPQPPDPRLIGIAAAFADLQDGRHAADYDLPVQIEFKYAAQLVTAAEAALADFDAIQSLPETTVFLTALLLADRWTRRG